MPEDRLGSMGALRAPVAPDSPRFPRVARSIDLPDRAYLAVPTATHDQGALGSCVGQAWAKALEIEYGSGAEVSALACYYWARVYSNPAWETQDTGALMAPSIVAMKERGAGSEALWPYLIDDFDERPAADYALQALDHRVVEARRATTVAEVKAALHAGHPAITAFDVPANFGQVGRDGLWRDQGGAPVGGHAVTVYGYDDELPGGPGYGAGCLLLLNSWGDDWGEPLHGNEGLGGGFRVPYSVFDDPRGRFWDGIVCDVIDETAGG